MEIGEVRDDGSLPAAAFTNERAAIWLGGRIVTVKARLDSRDRGFEQRIFDQNAFAPIHRFVHWLAPAPEVSFEPAAPGVECGKSRSASYVGRTSSSLKAAGLAILETGAVLASAA